MATIAVGDIHGNLSALEDLLAQVVPQLKADDTLVFLGDLIDRGSDSKGCIQRIVDLQAHGPCKVIALMGNHEQWMLRALQDPTSHSWLISMEAFETIASYSPAASEAILKEMSRLGPKLLIEQLPLPYDLFFSAMPSSHLSFFQDLRPYYDAPHVLCVHGGADLQGMAPRETDLDVLIWGCGGWPHDYQGSKEIAYGHWNNARARDGHGPQPFSPGNGTYGLDSISSGVLTAMRFPDHAVFHGRTRR